VTLLQWPVPATLARPLIDVLNEEMVLDREEMSNCQFINPIACYAIHNILVDFKTLYTKALSPLPYCNADDTYGLYGHFALKLPDPCNESAEPVSFYYTPLHTITYHYTVK
jgi:hypothetical protein